MMTTSQPSVLFLSHRQSAIRNEFGGQSYAALGLGPLGQKNPCSYTGMAYALGADFLTLKAVRSPAELAKYDLIFCAVSSLEDTEILLSYLKQNRTSFPRAVLVGQSEASVMSHRMACRNWQFQKAFGAFCELMDVFSTFTKTTIPYFQLFCKTEVVYVPFLYPTEWVSAQHSAGNLPPKESLVMKAGYIHGRLLADGYADSAPVAHLLVKRPDYRVAFLDYPKTKLDFLVETEADVGMVPAGVPHALRQWSLSAHRLQRKLVRTLRGRDLHSEALNNAYPFLSRGVRPEQILPLPRMQWREFLGWWAKSVAAIDMDTSYCVGRNVADAIATATPIIGVCSDYQEQLLPELKVEALDYEGAERLLARLLAEPDFRASVLAAGLGRLRTIDLTTAPARFSALHELGLANRARGSAIG